MRTIAILAALLLGACAPLPRNVVVLLDHPDGKTGSVEVSGEAASAVIDTPLRAVDIGDAGAFTEQIDVERTTAVAEFQDAFDAQPRPPETFLLYFVFGSPELTAESQALLPRIIAIAMTRTFVDISVIGHSDRVGPPGANASLSRRRADAVRDMLVDAGVDPAVIDATSHGEGNPLVPTPDEVPEPRNRRVEVTIR
jgi:outer membrane protein OmpA-like peptidoglycan-associated protein